jgi:hypothetical protein
VDLVICLMIAQLHDSNVTITYVEANNGTAIDCAADCIRHVITEMNGGSYWPPFFQVTIWQLKSA